MYFKIKVLATRNTLDESELLLLKITLYFFKQQIRIKEKLKKNK